MTSWTINILKNFIDRISKLHSTVVQIYDKYFSSDLYCTCLSEWCHLMEDLIYWFRFKAIFKLISLGQVEFLF